MSEAKTGRRLLALKEIFLRDTDENKQFSIKELVEKLKIEIPECTADAKTVKRYIQTLRATGFDIIENVEKYGEIFYSHQDRLFESYQIGEVLKRMLVSTSYEVKLQHTAKKLLQNADTGRDNILLKQDFVIETREQEAKIIIDTKWKSTIVNGKRNFKQGDIYQMYAYITTYKSAERCILLYPQTQEEGDLPRWLVPDYFPKKYIEVKQCGLIG